MRIAQIAPLYESVPPALYGGTERVVHYLTEELVAIGHDVTLFASADSQTSARLIPGCERALRLDPTCKDPLAHHMVMMSRVTEMCNEFDVLHFHIDYLHFALSRVMHWPQLTTLHGRLDLDELRTVYSHFNDMGLVSISNSQRQPIPSAKWLATVYHGLPAEELTPSEGTSDYFAFVGRVSPEKRLDRAIEIAKAVGTKIKIAAKVDSADQEYHERVIVPLLEHPLVEFVGEIDEPTKATFMGNAKALLFPIDWPEPFGLVMIESMACGTPVLAFRRGSVPEIIEHGVSGFVVDDMPAAIEAARRIERLDRTQVRKAFEQRFTARRMAEDYVRVYEQVSNVLRSMR